jgi:hypothetical protein
MAMENQTIFDARAHRERRRGVGDRRHELGPHSRWFRRGAVALLNGNSCEAKFIRTFEKAILDHLGGADRATIPQRLYAARLAKIALRLELLDRKLADRTLTEFDTKLMGGLTGQYRLMLRDLLGVKGDTLDRSPINPHLAALTPKRSEDAT